MTNLPKNTESAFLWITHILNEHHIPFQVTGGFAARLYGAKRELNDIDLDVPESRFMEIYPLVKEYVIFGPKQYTSENWDLLLMTLLYEGQEIDINGAYEGKMFDKKTGKWLPARSDLSTATIMNIYGVNTPVVNKGELVEYKKIVARDTDLIDVEYLT